MRGTTGEREREGQRGGEDRAREREEKERETQRESHRGEGARERGRERVGGPTLDRSVMLRQAEEVPFTEDCRDAHTLSLSLPLSFSLSLSLSLALSRTRSFSLSLSLTHTHTHTLSHALFRYLSLSHTLTLSHTSIHSRALPGSEVAVHRGPHNCLDADHRPNCDDPPCPPPPPSILPYLSLPIGRRWSGRSLRHARHASAARSTSRSRARTPSGANAQKP